MSEQKVVTRFAPSPTGFMHVGGVRTALFAWLLAKQNNGTFILRIEDTDKKREVKGGTVQIIKSLKSLGIDWQEGIDIGGPNGPYLQSERLDIYKEWAKKLIEKGLAYADPYTSEELDAFRQEARDNKKPFLYRDHRPENPPMWDGTQALRFKSSPKRYTWTDAIMGELSAGEEAIDDFILIKKDGYPTYNFCHIIDDYLMHVTHILRSQEFISSVPKFLNLYEALGIKRPVLATLPFVMAIDGKKKLAKRDGAKDVLDYHKDGILTEALINFLATLGWNDGTEQEIFSKEELIEKFSLERVQTSPARFDETRLIWLNGQWIRRLSLGELYEKAKEFFPESAKDFDESYKKQVLLLIKDRLKTLRDLTDHTNYFFTEPKIDMNLINGNKQLKKLPKEDLISLLESATSDLNAINDFSNQNIMNTLNNLLEKTGQKPGILFSLIRIATTWAPFSPELDKTLEVIDKEKTINRLRTAIEAIRQDNC